MSLRSKIVLILSAVVLLYAGLDHVIQRLVVSKSFVELERLGAEKDLQRVAHALQSEIERLDGDCAAWAASDETYRFVAEGDPRFVEQTLVPQTLDSKAIQLLYVCDTQGRVVWGRIRDHAHGQDLKLRSFPPGALSTSHPLLSGVEGDRSISGVFKTERGPMLVSSRSIVGATQGGASRGTLILGRFVDAPLIRALAERTEVAFDLWSVDDPALPDDAREVLDSVSAGSEPVVRAVDDEHLHAYTACNDIAQAPALLVRGNLDRDVSARGRLAVRYALISTVAAGLLIMLVLLNLLQRTVIHPISKLTAHAVTIGRSDDFTNRIGSDRGDEVGVLTREFDSMIGKLAQSRADLVKAARAAGMSEIATGVLHNVGNVLNSVNVSVSLVADKVRLTSARDLGQVMDALRPEQSDLAGFLQRDPRGKHLFPLLDSISKQLLEEQESLLREVRSLNEGVGHIKELVQAQQSHAGRAGVLETISIVDQVEAALVMTSQPGASRIEIVRDYEELPACPVDRHRLMEILVNVLKNAQQSLQEAGVEPARLRLHVSSPNAGRVRIEVTDNGVGIPRENLARVFTHGFTTKASGHGFGLHASANAATEMGGKLAAHSDGPGLGATFVLEVPVTRVPAAGVLT